VRTLRAAPRSIALHPTPLALHAGEG
jgi:hypothetical protein